MDLRHYFSASTSKQSSTPASSSSSGDDEPLSSDSSSQEPPPPKRSLSSMASYRAKSKYRPKSGQRKYSKKWEKEFLWLEYDENYQGAFCKICRKHEHHSSQKTGGAWITKPFKNWKKAVEKMRAHAKSDTHIRHFEAEVLAAQKEGSILQQLKSVTEEQRIRNRKGIKALLRCAHFLARNYIPHTTNFAALVDLIVSCGEDLKQFTEKSPRNATYTSTDSISDFLEALGLWVEESQLKRLRKAPFYSVMADECTDIATIEELSLFFRWAEGGEPVEHFFDIIPLKKADAASIYTTLTDWFKQKGIQPSKLVGMGFDGAATFSGARTGVQARLKKNSPRALYVHCHCHLLQLACVQAANHTPGIEHVYKTLLTLWKFFHYSPKRAEHLKSVQRVLDLPELKVTKPSDTRWLAHERCVKAVKESYASIVIALDSFYEQTHEPEALGLSKALTKKSTVMAMYLLDFVLPQVAKLSRCLQAEKLDLTAISGLVDSTLQTLDDALLPAANWVLELLDAQDKLQDIATIDSESITSFQDKVAKPFVTALKGNISRRFSSQDIVASFSIFDPSKLPQKDSPDLSSYGDEFLGVLEDHYGKELAASSVEGEEFTVPALVSSDIRTEWMTFRRYITTTQPKKDTMKLLMELATNTMLVEMFPHLSDLAKVCLSIPVGTASVERSFSQMKMIKTRLRNRLGEQNLAHLMRIAVEMPEKLPDDIVDSVVDVWNRKTRRIAV
jgi:hypothetical protein